MENENAGLNVETAATDVEAQTTENEESATDTEESVSKTFTQEQVNNVIKERLERANKSFLKRYGLENREALDDIVNKALSYDLMDEKYNALIDENSSLKEKLAFIENNIDNNRIDDVRAYFKGKELEFNNETLAEELKTHPEWLNVKEVNDTPQTTIKSLGIEHANVNKAETEDQKRKRIFGV